MIARARSSPAQIARQRRLFDGSMRLIVTAGGFTVLLVILFMFVFLIAAVVPLFQTDFLVTQQRLGAPAAAPVLFFDAAGPRLLLADGALAEPAASGRSWASSGRLLPPGERVARAVRSLREPALVAVLGDRGSLRLLVNGATVSVEPATVPAAVAVETDGDRQRLAVLGSRGELRLYEVPSGTLLATAELSLPETAGASVQLADDLARALILARDGRYWLFDLAGASALVPLARGDLLPGEDTFTAVLLEPRGRSLLGGTPDGSLRRFLLLPQTHGGEVVAANTLAEPGLPPVERLLPSGDGRGVVSQRRSGAIDLWYPPTGSQAPLRDAPPGSRLLRDARGNGFWLFHGDAAEFLEWRRRGGPGLIDALWQAVWYEGYAQPQRTWQTGAADDREQAKFGLAPLAFGTFKAALWTMLLVAPLAIAAAIYTAYFLPPRLRRGVKPAIELAEAFPTVLLGFLAGLWLAPRVEDHLAGVLVVLPALFVATVLGALLSAALRRRSARRGRSLRPGRPGWRGQRLVSLSRVAMPALVLAVLLLCLAGESDIEALLFDGDTTRWLRDRFGIDYKQRNAMVIGIAMGIAVLPTVFSLAEDAVASVPAALSDGSLALGATPWQTLWHVVLPSASPGVFSALMIGLGRAIGETMIVLMATGNTPILSVGLFDGMRTISATVALELPEAAVASSHYRILFFAALLLFTFTFVVNGVAELVRLRLRRRYLVG